jgi:hypothetical protein
MKKVEHFLAEERKHYIQCECGEWIDCRNLAKVFEHQHAYNMPKPEYDYSVKVGESIMHLRNKRRIHIN